MRETGVQVGSMEVTSFLSPVVLWLSFAFILGIFAIVSSVLLYHWYNYTFNKKISKKVMILYFSVSGIFVLSLTLVLLTLTL